jgi:hypothetical protein
MTGTSNFKVYPKDYDLEKISNEITSIKGIDKRMGFFFFSVFFIIILIFIVEYGRNLHIPGPDKPEVWLVILFLLSVPFAFVFVISKITQSLKRRTHRIILINSEISNNNNEAYSLTMELQKIFEESEKMEENLRGFLEKVSIILKQCNHDYLDNAYDPFWTGIELAAKTLDNFRNDIQFLCTNAKIYYKQLKGHTHNFPNFPINVYSLPNPTHVLEEYKKILRLGQTNYQFANIWGYRRTHKSLIAGFTSLGDAVNNIVDAINLRFQNVQETFRFEINSLMEEEILSRQAYEKKVNEQNKILDNTQHRRKPWF